MARIKGFTQELADTICERLVEGKSLRTICKEEGMPGRTTVLRWLSENEAFQAQYARAREEQADAIFDEIIEIADEMNTTIRDDGNGDEVKVVFDNTAVQRNRLRVDARKWAIAKMLPKKYGERLQLQHSGAIQNLSDEEVEARLATLMAKADAGNGADGE